MIRFDKSSIIAPNPSASDTTADHKSGGRRLPNLYFILIVLLSNLFYFSGYNFAFRSYKYKKLMRVAKSYSDAEVTVALRDSKQVDDAIRFLYREYYGLLESYVINNKGSRDDAADIIQETMVAFVEITGQNKFRGEASIKSFLYSITRNLWLAELRKRSSTENRNRVFETARDTTEKETVQHLVQREQHSFIIQLFEKLGSKCKQLLMLVYFEDLSMTDILPQMPDYENEQVLRNKKYKCMKQLETMMQGDETLRTQFKNALKHAG